MAALSPMLLIATAALALLANLASAAPSEAISSAKKNLKFNFGHDTIRGVSLGGWLLLEVSYAFNP